MPIFQIKLPKLIIDQNKPENIKFKIKLTIMYTSQNQFSPSQSSKQHEKAMIKNNKYNKKALNKKLNSSPNNSDSSSFDQKIVPKQNKPALQTPSISIENSAKYATRPSFNKICIFAIGAMMDIIYFVYQINSKIKKYRIKWYGYALDAQNKRSIFLLNIFRQIKEQRIRNLQLQIIQHRPQQCAKCKQPLRDQLVFNPYYQPLDCKNPFQLQQKITLTFSNHMKSIKCWYCKKQFHYDCFNIRCHSLNCTRCQNIIRKQGPKGHQKFVQYYKAKSIAKLQQNKYFKLTPLPHYLCDKSQKCAEKLNLKLPQPVDSWQLITQYQASIYYAFQTKKLNFTEDQIYQSQQVMKLNRWDSQTLPLLKLDPSDQKIFQQFKSNTQNGMIVGPYQIKQDRIKGFHIVATDFIEKMTIVTEYVGEVVSARRSLFHHNQNDSVFSLIKNTRSCLSLDIVPHSFGNIGRFFLGINNLDIKARKLLNVQVIKFNYKGRARIIFYTTKNIQAGDTLYFDYNGSGIIHQYPTQNFE